MNYCIKFVSTSDGSFILVLPGDQFMASGGSLYGKYVSTYWTLGMITEYSEAHTLAQILAKHYDCKVLEILVLYKDK